MENRQHFLPEIIENLNENQQSSSHELPVELDKCYHDYWRVFSLENHHKNHPKCFTSEVFQQTKKLSMFLAEVMFEYYEFPLSISSEGTLKVIFSSLKLESTLSRRGNKDHSVQEFHEIVNRTDSSTDEVKMNYKDILQKLLTHHYMQLCTNAQAIFHVDQTNSYGNSSNNNRFLSNFYQIQNLIIFILQK